MPNFITALFQRLQPASTTLGIEITDSMIKAAEMSIKKRKLPQLNSFECERLQEKTVDDGRILNAGSVTRAIETICSRMDTKCKNVHMVIPSQSVMVRFLKFPDIPQQDLAKLIDFEIKHNIHLPFEDPIYDFIKLNENEPSKVATLEKKEKKKSKTKKSSDEETFQQAAASKDAGFDLRSIDNLFGDSQTNSEEEKLQCDVMLVIAPGELVKEYMEVAHAAGLKVKSLEIKALSLFRVMETSNLCDPKSTCLVVDINEKASDLSIFHDGLLKITRSVPVSFLPTSKSKETRSEIDSMFADFADPDEDFRTACQDLSHELERLINFYRYSLNNRNQEFGQLLLSGDVLRLNEIGEVLGQRLNLKVKTLYSPKVQANHLLFYEMFPVYAVPIGLALRGNKG